MENQNSTPVDNQVSKNKQKRIRTKIALLEAEMRSNTKHAENKNKILASRIDILNSKIEEDSLIKGIPVKTSQTKGSTVQPKTGVSKKTSDHVKPTKTKEDPLEKKFKVFLKEGCVKAEERVPRLALFMSYLNWARVNCPDEEPISKVSFFKYAIKIFSKKMLTRSALVYYYKGIDAKPEYRPDPEEVERERANERNKSSKKNGSEDSTDEKIEDMFGDNSDDESISSRVDSLLKKDGKPKKK